ncbi:MAG: hypothetical protein NWF01_00715 [Candidatus Bathyarchaeota archaeon]|nr:hypothetical protein [Candidatus Bathyarchaeota archaeon]
MNSGKLMVYSSGSTKTQTRLDAVTSAAQQTAKQLNLGFELVSLKCTGSPIYVYYEEGNGGEPVPLYCDDGKMSGLEEISGAIRNMMFVLSFHPKHTALASLRNEVLKLS